MHCSDTPDAEHVFSELTIDGIPVAQNSGGPKHDGELFSYVPVVTLHQDTERPDSFLYQNRSFIRTVKGFFLDGDGRYYVNDSGGARIAVFGPDGRYERSLGRQGQGPGEFMICELIDLSDDILTSIDYNLHRTTRYHTDGRLIEVVPGRGRFSIGSDLFFGLHNPSHYDQNGHLWMGSGYLVTTATGDTVGSASTPQIRINFEFDTPGHGKGGKSRPPVPYTDRPFGLYIADGSVLLTDGVDQVLIWHRLDGSIRKKIETGIPSQPVTSQERDRFFRDLDSQFRNADDNQKVYLGWLRDAVVFPEYRTLWSHISVDDAGYIWLEGFEMDFERRDRRGDYTYYLLSPEGEFLGTTRTPGVGRVSRGFFLGEVTDPETDRVEYTVWRMVPRSEDFAYP
ncbi:6-bladed beta-propeller [Gemmatimonadota bacterium]